MALNIPLGTHFGDGVRSGTIYSGRISAGFVADINGVITSSDYSTYGPGILLSSQNTYNITPSPPGTGAGNTILNNIVATTVNGAVPAATYLTLRGDNASTYYTTGANGFPLVQLDWPRVVTVTISGADAMADTRVTILGYDYYGFPMQHTYVVEAQQTYPIVTVQSDDDGTISLPCKAFYQVTGAYINAGLPVDCLISLGAADVFGLPYVINGPGAISSISWGTQTAGGPPNPNPIVPLSEMTEGATAPNNGRFYVKGAFVPADKTLPATADTTGDVRGLYAVSTPASAQTVATVDVDWKKLIFTAYIEGADTWINQVAAKQQQYIQQTGNPPQGIAISPQEPADLYGVSQFYTGVPS